MIILRFVKTGHIFQNILIRGTDKNYHERQGVLNLYFSNLSFQKVKRHANFISIKPVSPIASSLEPTDRFSLM